MNQYELIFSKGRNRFLRHLIFWIAWILFSSTVQLTAFKPGPIAFGDLVLYQLLRSISRLPSILIFCYVTVYFLVPMFISAKKYVHFVFSFFFFAFLLYLFNYYFLTRTYHIPGIIVGNVDKVLPLSPFIRKFYSFYSNINFTGAIPACCLMLAIKYYKDWYKKQNESEVLHRENKLAELQLLKAQIHPHFLFNTLNNIYSFTLTGSPQAADLVDKLSGMINYMTTEGQKSYVPLGEELQLIHDYIGLEKIRYGDRLDLLVEINGTYKNKIIAPLLMIPFVENCFKHGASAMRGQQWIKLSININEDQLDFKLSNSKPPDTNNINGKKGIGLANVQKRLQLLYPGMHFLKTESTGDCYIVHLQISLQRLPVLQVENKQMKKLQRV
jgi:sensor histidine kinase YesM